MEINTTKHRVEHSGVQKHYQAKMEANEKSFELVMAGLYSDPIKAFIRELSTNAYEAHQLLGIEDKPFDVWLPTYTNLNFKIRDYGPGISESEAEHIYMTIFKSTKEQTNDFGGCFGLGSKSPYAYTGNAPFSVTSFYNGKKYSYVSYRDEDGIPCLDLLNVEDGYNETGVEITVPVKKNDVEAIHNKAELVYSWFNIKPNFKSMYRKLNYNNAQNSLTRSEKDYTIHNSDDVNFIKMDNIIYPIDFNILKLRKCFRGIIIDAPIGSVVPMPSREGLRYNGHTVSYLTDFINNVNDVIIDKFKSEIDKCKNYYEAVRYANANIGSFYNISLSDLNYNGRVLESGWTDLKHSKSYGKSWRTGKISFNVQNQFHPSHNYGFFYVDSSASNIRIIDYCKTNNIKDVVVCTKDNNLKDAADEIGIDESYFIRTSTLPYIPPLRGTKKGSTNGHKTKVLKWKGSGLSSSFAWEDSTIDLSTQTGYYVEYYSNKVKFITKDGKELSLEPTNISIILDTLGLPSTTEVYGIKSELLKKMNNSVPNMENLLTKVEDWCYNNENAFVQSYTAKLTLGKISNVSRFKHIYDNNSHILQVTNLISDIINRHKVCEELFNKYNSYTKIALLIQKRHLDIEYSGKYTPDIKLISDVDLLNKKYPLVNEVYGWMDEKGTELAYYILGKGN